MMNPWNRLVEPQRKMCVLGAANFQRLQVKKLIEVADKNCKIWKGRELICNPSTVFNKFSPDKFFRFSVDNSTKASTSCGKEAIKSFGSMFEGKRHMVNFKSSLFCGEMSSSNVTCWRINVHYRLSHQKFNCDFTSLLFVASSLESVNSWPFLWRVSTSWIHREIDKSIRCAYWQTQWCGQIMSTSSHLSAFDAHCEQEKRKLQF